MYVTLLSPSPLSPPLAGTQRATTSIPHTTPGPRSGLDYFTSISLSLVVLICRTANEEGSGGETKPTNSVLRMHNPATNSRGRTTYMERIYQNRIVGDVVPRGRRSALRDYSWEAGKQANYLPTTCLMCCVFR